MKVRYMLIAIAFFVTVPGLVSCKKYLETKSDQTLSTPSTLNDLQLLLDNPQRTTGASLLFGGTDEYFIKYNDYQTRQLIQQQAYIWDPALNDYSDWTNLYQTVFYANNVLLNLETISSKNNPELANSIKGSALFIRSNCFFQLAQLFAPQYVESTAASDLGIPLRLNADINEASIRSSVQKTYEQIINDLQTALPLLPTTTASKIRPTKAACYALLARTYLQKGDYSKARDAANQCLSMYNTLIDYNTLSAAPFYPLPTYDKNQEVLYYNSTDAPLNANYVRSKADSNLYKSYDINDLRKQLFYLSNGDGTYAYRGNYTGEFALFNGLATDEVYLIKAESEARLGNTNASINALNTLLQNRWKSGTFIPISASTPDQALSIILAERKKELVNRGTRWPDLRRLNKDPKFAITLTRNLNGTIYQLPPNDLRYVLLIPQEVMNTTKLEQNPR